MIIPITVTIKFNLDDSDESRAKFAGVLTPHEWESRLPATLSDAQRAAITAAVAEEHDQPSTWINPSDYVDDALDVMLSVTEYSVNVKVEA